MAHPYRVFENTPAWAAIAAALAELEGNQDLRLTTDREHITGYLCQQLAAAGIIAADSLPKN